MNYIRKSYIGLEELGASPPISRVILYDDAENAFAAGDESGYTIEGDCAWATQAMAEAVLAQLKGYEYRAYSAEGCYLDPAAELGDPVAVGEVYSVIASIDADCGAAFTADIGAPIDGEVDHEFTYEGETVRRLKRTVQLGHSYFGTTITRRDGLVIEKTDGENVSARVRLNTDVLEFSKIGEDGGEVKCFYYDAPTGQFVLNSGVNVDEAVENSQPFYDLNLSAYNLTLRMGDAEGNISALEQTAKSLSSTIQDTKTGLQSQIAQTASGLESKVSDLDGKYTSLKQTVDGFDIEGDVNMILQDGLAEINFVDYRDRVTSGMYVDDDRVFCMYSDYDLNLRGDRVLIDADATEIYGDCRIYLTASKYWEFDTDGIHYHSSGGESVTVMNPV